MVALAGPMAPVVPRGVDRPRALAADTPGASETRLDSVSVPMLADLDDPPTSRWRALAVGVGVAAVLVAATAFFVMPAMHSSIIGESREFDARLRLEDSYMHAVCSDALVVDRDEELCMCALAAEFPSLDCRAAFEAWTLARQSEQCRAGVAEANGFCGCVASLVARLDASDPADEKARRLVVADYAHCAALPDALFLPEVAALAEAAPPAPP